MLDFHIFDYLSTKAESFEIRHNAHRETRTTVARHLLHRERLGDTLLFAGHQGRSTCIETDNLWEVNIASRTGAQIHIVGPALDLCLQIAQANLEGLEKAAA